MKDHFLEVVDKLTLSAPPPFEDTKEEENQFFTMFEEHPEGEGVLIIYAPYGRLELRRESSHGVTSNPSPKLNQISFLTRGARMS